MIAEIPYWGQSLLRVLGGIVAVLLPAGTIVYLFLFKMMSFMQSRLGPMEAGPYGSMQLFAEVGKWLQKEEIHPEKADTFVFKLAPIVVLVSTFLLIAVVPFGPARTGREPEVRLLPHGGGHRVADVHLDRDRMPGLRAGDDAGAVHPHPYQPGDGEIDDQHRDQGQRDDELRSHGACLSDWPAIRRAPSAR